MGKAEDRAETQLLASLQKRLSIVTSQRDKASNEAAQWRQVAEQLQEELSHYKRMEDAKRTAEVING